MPDDSGIRPDRLWPAAERQRACLADRSALALPVMADHRASSSGFTLTELLVVIAIVLILAGLLTPVVNRVLIQSQQTRCGSNLRQVSMVFLAYRGDFAVWPKVEGGIAYIYPHTVAHITAPSLPEYFSEYASGALDIFYCPRNAQKRSPSTHWPNSGISQYAMTYQVMMWANPATFVVARPNYERAGSTTLMFSDMLPTSDPSRQVGVVWNHDNGNGVSGMNVSYGDGRVVWMSATGVWTRWYRDAGIGYHWWTLGW
jgi:prepilin-type N-terminal cleavage/methylation domain-containing protein